MTDRIKIYKWTRRDGSTGDRQLHVTHGFSELFRLPRIVWLPGLVICASHNKCCRFLCSLNLLHAFRSLDDAHEHRHTCGIPLDHSVLWEGEGYVYQMDMLKVGCRAMVLHRIIEPKVHSG